MKDETVGLDTGTPLPDGDLTYRTAGGVIVRRTATAVDETVLTDLADSLDTRRGGVLSSGVEYPGRYSRWHMGYIDPPVELVAHGRRLTATALNARGRVLLRPIGAAFDNLSVEKTVDHDTDRVTVHVPAADGDFPEEERSRRPSIFTALRALVDLFHADADPHLGLYGAYGYDLVNQFEPLRLRHARPDNSRDLVLHLPDRLVVVDRKRETSVAYAYDFEVPNGARVDDGGVADDRAILRTDGLARRTPDAPARSSADSRGLPELPAQPEPGRFAGVVAEALECFTRGDLFEVTPGQVLYGRCASPSAFHRRLREYNPAPYEFFFNLGDGEHLVAASPEMYVRVTGRRVETCPIAGTIARGTDALGDAEQIRTLLNSTKDEAELTMCTDVDRNDKSRICVPGSVRVIGRRQIELYRRLIHTVDHIEGELRSGFDAFDAFGTHMWAVTVTGAPKQWAMQFIEDHEDSPRRWYGAAAGFTGFDGSMNTGLTLRAASIVDGIAAVRVGATLLSDSDPAAEERETHLKAAALFDMLDPTPGSTPGATPATAAPALNPTVVTEAPGAGMRVLVVDHCDSFVLTLADYFRQAGAEVVTRRYGFSPTVLDGSASDLAGRQPAAPDLVVLSPGPGRPTDFGCDALLDELDARRLPVFGVCLGLQAMVEHAGGELSLLGEPAHGKPATVQVTGGRLLAEVAPEFTAGRYHSLFARPEHVKGFEVTAITRDPAAGSDKSVAMAIENAERRRWATQFHPESILTAGDRVGHRIIDTVLGLCRASG